MNKQYVAICEKVALTIERQQNTGISDKIE